MECLKEVFENIYTILTNRAEMRGFSHYCSVGAVLKESGEQQWTGPTYSFSNNLLTDLCRDAAISQKYFDHS